jgi:hypothetical protein
VLYRWIHKQHHEYTGSIGFAAEYAHPIEALLANLLPTMGYAVAAGVHPLVFVLWLAWRLEETYEAHSELSSGDWRCTLSSVFIVPLTRLSPHSARRQVATAFPARGSGALAFSTDTTHRTTTSTTRET